jgi:hypothetical protein
MHTITHHIYHLIHTLLRRFIHYSNSNDRRLRNLSRRSQPSTRRNTSRTSLTILDAGHGNTVSIVDDIMIISVPLTSIIAITRHNSIHTDNSPLHVSSLIVYTRTRHHRVSSRVLAASASLRTSAAYRSLFARKRIHFITFGFESSLRSHTKGTGGSSIVVRCRRHRRLQHSVSNNTHDAHAHITRNIYITRTVYRNAHRTPCFVHHSLLSCRRSDAQSSSLIG